jgi:predicted nucleic acid-binding protein
LKNNRNTQRILLDTSFLLPSLGIAVEQSVTEALSKLNDKRIKPFYSNLSLLESSWMAIKQMKKGNYQDEIYRKGLLSITKTGYYEMVPTDANDYLVALDFYQNGHADMIDNLLYAVALSNRCKFLTIDNQLIRFIKEKKYEDAILTPKDI